MKAILTIEIEFDENKTDADAVGVAVDTLIETAMTIPGVLEEYGDPGSFSIGQTYILNGTSECPEGGAHEPDSNSVDQADDSPGVCDVNCAKCGTSGAFRPGGRYGIDW